VEEREKRKIFNEEMYPHEEALLVFAKKLTSDPDEAQDLLQDTYLKAWRFIESFDSGSNAKAWLHRIMKNSFINDFRKESRKPIHLDVNDMVNQVEDYSLDIKNIFELNDCLDDEILLSLLDLPDDYSAILIVSDIWQFSYQDMAIVFDIPIGTVRSRLFRARNELKDKLKHLASEKGYKINRK